MTHRIEETGLSIDVDPYEIYKDDEGYDYYFVAQNKQIQTVITAFICNDQAKLMWHESYRISSVKPFELKNRDKIGLDAPNLNLRKVSDRDF